MKIIALRTMKQGKTKIQSWHSKEMHSCQPDHLFKFPKIIQVPGTSEKENKWLGRPRLLKPPRYAPCWCSLGEQCGYLSPFSTFWQERLKVLYSTFSHNSSPCANKSLLRGRSGRAGTKIHSLSSHYMCSQHLNLKTVTRRLSHQHETLFLKLWYV